MGVRIRQIALIAQDIDYSVDVLTAMFDTYVAFRDPGIVPQFGGMFNALLAFGDCFLEFVSPTDSGYEKNSTTVKLLRKTGGDCGYMAILQVDDIAATSTRLAAVGGKMVMGGGHVLHAAPGAGPGKSKGFRYKIGDALAKAPGTCAGVTVQWHPKDFGTLLETDESFPPDKGAAGTWNPAGNRWQNTYKTRPASSVCEEFAAVEIALPPGSVDPAAMARRWGEGLGCPVVGDGRTVQLDGSTVRFAAARGDGRVGVTGVDVYAAPGKPKAFTECDVLGIRWRLVDRPGAAGTAPLYATLGASAAKL